MINVAKWQVIAYYLIFIVLLLFDFFLSEENHLPYFSGTVLAFVWFLATIVLRVKFRVLVIIGFGASFLFRLFDASTPPMVIVFFSLQLMTLACIKHIVTSFLVALYYFDADKHPDRYNFIRNGMVINKETKKLEADNRVADPYLWEDLDWVDAFWVLPPLTFITLR